jgi:uncharacterized membrane protein YidH (DUF202 family)
MTAAVEVRRATRSDWLERLGRVGLAAKGVSYGLVGVLALKLAFGAGGKATSRQGAFQTLAHDAFGRAVLIGLAIGFAAYAAWRFANSVLDRNRRGDDPPGLAKRTGELVKSLIYIGLTWSVITVLLTSHASGGNQKHEAAGVFGWPGGRWIVLAVGVAIAGYAAWNIYSGVTRTFEEKLERAPDWVKPVGVIGLSVRGVVFAVVAWFLIKAALEFDPQKAVGLGGALAKLAQAPYGSAVLGLTAVGLIVFGAYCLVEARYRNV